MLECLRCYKVEYDYAWIDRSSHQRCSMKKCVLKNFAKFRGKHSCQSLFFNKVVSGLQLY